MTENLSFEASFRIFHPTADLAQVSAALGETPNFLHMAGCPRKNPKGDQLPGVYKQSYWSKVVHQGRTATLPAVIYEFNSKLERNRELLRAIVDTGGQMHYFVGIFVTTNCAELLEPDLLLQCAELKVGLMLDFYPWSLAPVC